jgi:bifunctional non-homologous end joining protein LigD
VVPLRPVASYDAVRDFAVRFATLLVEREPGLFTLEQRKADRGERLYLDIWRNGYGQTAVPPYAVRPKPGAHVAVPLEWDELSRVEPDGFDMASVRRRLARRGDPWKDMRRHAATLTRPSHKLARLTP